MHEETSPTDPYRLPLERAYRHALRWVRGLDERPVGAPADIPTLRRALDVGLAQNGLPPERVIDELAAAAEHGLHGSAGGRFFAWVVGGSVPASLAADWLVSAWDQNAALQACAPAAAVVEEIAGKWMLDLLDLPADASFAWTNGCQLAHTTALAAARNSVLARAGWDVESDGLSGSPGIRVLANAHHHGSTARSLRLLGFGARATVRVDTDQLGRIRPEALETALAEHAGPKIVLLNAGDLNVGSFDDFASLIPMAHAAGAWVHVDGAFGLFARASPAYRHLTEGIELANSWATDGHKWLNVPYDCGFAAVRDVEAHRASMALGASYLTSATDGRDEMDWNLEWSRRARGFPVYAALRELGRDGVTSMVDRCCQHCRDIVAGIGALEGAEALHEPVLNQGLVRFTPPQPRATTQDWDEHNDATITKINATGEAYLSGTTWQRRRAMRVSVVNWMTSEQDVQRTVDAVRSVLSSR